MHPYAASIRASLFIQAALTGLFAFVPTNNKGPWLALQLAFAAGAIVLAALLTSATPAMRVTILGFEGVAVLVGVLGLTQNHYIPGTIIAVGVLIRMLTSHGSAFTAGPAVIPPAPAPVWPDEDPKPQAPSLFNWTDTDTTVPPASDDLTMPVPVAPAPVTPQPVAPQPVAPQPVVHQPVPVPPPAAVPVQAAAPTHAEQPVVPEQSLVPEQSVAPPLPKVTASGGFSILPGK
jgi:hypothetical protein